MNCKFWTFFCLWTLMLGLASTSWADSTSHPQTAHSDSDTAVSAQIATPYDHDKASVQHSKMTQDQKAALKARREAMRKARETMLKKHREESKTEPKKRNAEFQSTDKLQNQNREQKKAHDTSEK